MTNGVTDQHEQALCMRSRLKSYQTVPQTFPHMGKRLYHLLTTLRGIKYETNISLL